MNDDENTMKYVPHDMHGNKFVSTISKTMNLQSTLFLEDKEKYLNRFNAEIRAE